MCNIQCIHANQCNDNERLYIEKLGILKAIID